jgi:hypothetical protein
VQGPPGVDGKDGEDGENGRDGLDGKDGVDGKDGKKGSRGPVGPKGDQGDRGEVGPRGVAGARGKQGPKGDRGPKGDVGDKGDPGDRGEQGDVGFVKAKYPLSYDADNKTLSLDQKTFEQLLSLPGTDPMLANNLINAMYGGGGGLGALKDGKRLRRDITDLDFTGKQINADVQREGTRVEVSLNKVSRTFYNTQAQIEAISVSEFVDGDFHVNIDTGNVYVRSEGNWIQI